MLVTVHYQNAVCTINLLNLIERSHSFMIHCTPLAQFTWGSLYIITWKVLSLVLRDQVALLHAVEISLGLNFFRDLCKNKMARIYFDSMQWSVAAQWDPLLEKCECCWSRMQRTGGTARGSKHNALPTVGSTHFLAFIMTKSAQLMGEGLKCISSLKLLSIQKGKVFLKISPWWLGYSNLQHFKKSKKSVSFSVLWNLVLSPNSPVAYPNFLPYSERIKLEREISASAPRCFWDHLTTLSFPSFFCIARTGQSCLPWGDKVQRLRKAVW